MAQGRPKEGYQDDVDPRLHLGEIHEAAVLMIKISQADLTSSSGCKEGETARCHLVYTERTRTAGVLGRGRVDSL